MANLDISKISDQLTELAIDANELSNDKSIVKLINNIDNVRDACAGFGGEIARVMPIKLKMEIDSLTGLYNQICTTSRAVAEGLKGLVDYMDAIPLGQLRKKSFMNTPNSPIASSSQRGEVQNSNVDENGVGEQAPVVTSQAPEASSSPRSALLQDSMNFWNNVKNNIRRESYAFQRGEGYPDRDNQSEFQRIKENLKENNFDFNNVDFINNDGTLTEKNALWRSICNSLGQNQSRLNETLANTWDGKVEAPKLHMVENIYNTSNERLNLVERESQRMLSDDNNDIVTFVDE